MKDRLLALAGWTILVTGSVIGWTVIIKALVAALTTP